MKYRGPHACTAPLDNRPYGAPHALDTEFLSGEANIISILPPLSLDGLLGAMRRLSETPVPNTFVPFVYPDDL